MSDIKQSNNPDWLGHFLKVDDDSMSIAKPAIFRAKKLATYQDSQVTEFKLMDHNSTAVGTKSAMKSVGGAVVGGLLTGGIGAIVGGSAAGHKIVKTETQQVAIQFDDGNWIIVEYNVNDEKFLGKVGKAEFDIIMKRLARKAASPFDTAAPPQGFSAEDFQKALDTV